MLPALKECHQLQILYLFQNRNFKKAETVNLLLKELPGCLEDFYCQYNGGGEFEDPQYDVKLLKERSEKYPYCGIYIRNEVEEDDDD